MWKPILGVLLVAAIGAWLLLQGSEPGPRRHLDATPSTAAAASAASPGASGPR